MIDLIQSRHEGAELVTKFQFIQITLIVLNKSRYFRTDLAMPGIKKFVQTGSYLLFQVMPGALQCLAQTVQQAFQGSTPLVQPIPDGLKGGDVLA